MDKVFEDKCELLSDIRDAINEYICSRESCIGGSKLSNASFESDHNSGELIINAIVDGERAEIAIRTSGIHFVDAHVCDCGNGCRYRCSSDD